VQKTRPAERPRMSSAICLIAVGICLAQSCPWVGLGWVEIVKFLVGWVGSTTAKVLKKFERIILMHLKYG